MNRLQEQRQILADILTDAGHPDAAISQHPRFIIIDPGVYHAPTRIYEPPNGSTAHSSPAHDLAPFALFAVDVRAWIAAELRPEGPRIPLALPQKLDHQESFLAANPVYAERTATRALRKYLEAHGL